MGSKTGVGGTAIPPIDPPPPKWHPPPPSGKALYVGLESVLGIGEGVPIPIPGGRSLPWGWVVGTVRAVRNPLPSATGRAPSFQVRSHPAATCAVVLVGIPRSARYDNAYYQTMTPSPGGWEILGRHRASEPGACYQVRRPGASSIRSGLAVGLGLRPGLWQLRSGRPQVRRHPGQVLTFQRHSAAVEAPSRQARRPEPEQ
jgi:hypothetical protein